METNVLPFRRPHVVVFERFEAEDMAAFFHARKDQDVYHFTLLADGELDEWFIRRDDLIIPSDDCTEPETARMAALYREASAIYHDQLKTWADLGPSEKLALLIHWGEETLGHLKKGILAAAKEDAQEYAEEIALMCKDIECHEAYLSGLEAALTVLLPRRFSTTTLRPLRKKPSWVVAYTAAPRWGVFFGRCFFFFIS